MLSKKTVGIRYGKIDADLPPSTLRFSTRLSKGNKIVVHGGLTYMCSIWASEPRSGSGNMMMSIYIMTVPSDEAGKLGSCLGIWALPCRVQVTERRGLQQWHGGRVCHMSLWVVQWWLKVERRARNSKRCSSMSAGMVRQQSFLHEHRLFALYSGASDGTLKKGNDP